ncbi:unnamed protein product [Cyprideis torosa]|uniref:SAM domain-containing protein n=1 Tax=Cyprideis torosa TaxID=163714 RepID=A0A7R8WI74_9CRUS|nr:unnamed protein product [Cyprideis torosa]CAG0900367.1 unnamed protein product [Cyprideis torosa]
MSRVRDSQSCAMEEHEDDVFMPCDELQQYVDAVFHNASLTSARNLEGWNPLMYAVALCHYDITAFLLSQLDGGSHLKLLREREPRLRRTVLMLAAAGGFDDILQALLLADGHELVDEVDHRGWTALCYAAAAGVRSTVALLLSFNACALRGQPLRVAVERGHGSEVTNLLCQAAGQRNLSRGPEHMSRLLSTSRPVGDSGICLRTNDVKEFLNQLGLVEECWSKFREEEIDMQVLVTLTDRDLRDLGINKLGPRRKLTSAIAQLQSRKEHTVIDIPYLY